MKITKENFRSVGSQLKIPEEQLNTYWDALEKMDVDSESTQVTRYLFYLGALVVISSMTWFVTLGFEFFGGGGVFLIASGYAFLFALMGGIFWNKGGLRLPSGLLVAMAVCMVPLAIYGLEEYYQLWGDNKIPYQKFYELIDARWVYMEIGTIVAGLLALLLFPHPAVATPVFVAAWFLTMDIVPFFFGKEIQWEQKCWISIGFGLILMVIGFFIDRKNKEEYGFWSYFFGTISFWGGMLGCVWEKGEGVLFLFLLINLVMIFASIFVSRKVLMVFGGFGVYLYLAHLAQVVFKDSILFPFALSVLGLAVIFLGIWYQRNAKTIEEKIVKIVPISFRTIFRK